MPEVSGFVTYFIVLATNSIVQYIFGIQFVIASLMKCTIWAKPLSQKQFILEIFMIFVHQELSIALALHPIGSILRTLGPFKAIYAIVRPL